MKKLLLLLFLIPNLVMGESQLEIYDCVISNDINQSHRNASECNNFCKKTGRFVKFKVNENNNKILMSYYKKNGNFLFSQILKDDDDSFVGGRLVGVGDKVNIFDENNWTYTSGSLVIGIFPHVRKIELREGKEFYNTFKEYGNPRSRSAPPPTNECGK